MGYLSNNLKSINKMIWIIFLISIFVAYAIWNGSKNYFDSRSFNTFNNNVLLNIDQIEKKISTYENALYSGIGFFQGSDYVSRDDWHNFILALDLPKNYPGMQGLGLVLLTDPNNTSKLKFKMRVEGFPSFEIKPKGYRLFYTPVVYLEPMDKRNIQAIGYDITTESVRRIAMERARDTGLATISGKITLVQEIDSDVQSGIIMFKPLYEAGKSLQTKQQRSDALIGYVDSPFRMNDLMKHIVLAHSIVDMEIYDNSNMNVEHLLYRSFKPSAIHKGKYFTTRTLQLYGQTWYIKFWSTPKFDQESSNFYPLFITFVGLFIYFVLLIFTVTLFRDKKNLKLQARKLKKLSLYDSLTNLPNRNYLEVNFKDILSNAQRNSKEFSIVFLDVDHFKDINDTLGHRAGDDFLILVAERLKNALREEDIIARFGGDEFILLLPNSGSNTTLKVVQKIQDIITLPYHIEKHELNITLSMGIAIYPNDGDTLETLYKKADTAMYRAKQEGRNRYSFFTDEMQNNALHHFELSNALSHALERNEFELFYQPQISTLTQKIIGAEALLRWKNPLFLNISPAEFIPILENNGMILAVGEWVLRTAAFQAKSWMESGSEPMIISVNVSAVQFRHPNLPDMITQTLKEAQLPPEYLELELTESVTMQDPHKAINIMNDLHDRGVRMSIDDFGTGYSSLSYLKKFKVYKLKIDQSFIRDLSIDSEDKAIVAAIIKMTKSLDIKTIAEGVETVAQLDYLREQGCDEIQGYYYSKPLSINDFEDFRNKKYIYLSNTAN